MAVDLTPIEVADLTGATVTAAMIATANQVCDDETGYTFAEHNSSRLVPEAMCEQAWAIATVNVAKWFTVANDDRSVQAESQGDYSYNVDVAERVRVDNQSPITGPVRRLLRLSQATWAHI